DALGARDAAGLNHTVKLSLSRSLEHQVRWYLIRPRRTPPIPRAGAAAIRRLADLTIHGVLQVRPWPQSPSPPPSPRFILTGAVGVPQALRQEAHRCATSGLDQRRHPGSVAAMA